MLFVKNLVYFWVRIINNFFFYFKNKRKISRFLSSKGIIKVKPFNLVKWHHNVYLFKGTSEINGALFIKLSTDIGFLDNENNAYDILGSDLVLKNHLIKKVGFFKIEQFDVLVLEQSHGQTLTYPWFLENLQATTSLINIVERLSVLKLIHRDLKPDNFIYENNEIKIFDFTFMISNDENINLKELDLNVKDNVIKLMVVGINYKPSVFIWDDFFSLKTIFDNAFLNQNTKKLNDKERDFITEKINYCVEKCNTVTYTILKN